MQKILGIETSCDETAAAVYDSVSGIKSNVLFSQIKLHEKYGGVIPEIAARSHIEKITFIVDDALKKANATLTEIDTIAVTNKPGLAGSLLVGVCFAKALAWAEKKRLIAVNHLEGHIFSSFLENKVPFPHICLTASGGHTALYLVHDFGVFELLGETLDDAAGEAFDKIAKILHLPYPGGPIIERYAQSAGFKDYDAYPRSLSNRFDFSFSGLKTAVLYDLVKKNLYHLQSKTLSSTITQHEKEKIASSLLVCIKDIFIQKIELALHTYPKIKAVTFVGGVACNVFLKTQLDDLCKRKEIAFFSPSRQFCTDNAAMIALVGNYKREKNEFSDFNLDILS